MLLWKPENTSKKSPYGFLMSDVVQGKRVALQGELWTTAPPPLELFVAETQNAAAVVEKRGPLLTSPPPMKALRTSARPFGTLSSWVNICDQLEWRTHPLMKFCARGDDAAFRQLFCLVSRGDQIHVWHPSVVQLHLGVWHNKNKSRPTSLAVTFSVPPL